MLNEEIDKLRSKSSEVNLLNAKLTAQVRQVEVYKVSDLTTMITLNKAQFAACILYTGLHNIRQNMIMFANYITAPVKLCINIDWLESPICSPAACVSVQPAGAIRGASQGVAI